MQKLIRSLLVTLSVTAMLLVAASQVNPSPQGFHWNRSTQTADGIPMPPPKPPKPGAQA